MRKKVNRYLEGFQTITLPIIYPIAEGASGLERRLEELCDQASTAVEGGVNVLKAGTKLGTTAGAVEVTVQALLDELQDLVDDGRIIAINPAVYFIDHLPVQVNPLDLLLIVVASVVVPTLATLYPARQAALLHPVDAIRYE